MRRLCPGGRAGARPRQAGQSPLLPTSVGGHQDMARGGQPVCPPKRPLAVVALRHLTRARAVPIRALLLPFGGRSPVNIMRRLVSAEVARASLKHLRHNSA